MDRENSSTNNNSRIRELISRLDTEHRLSLSEYEEVLKNRTEEDEKFAQELAVKWRKKIRAEFFSNCVQKVELLER